MEAFRGAWMDRDRDSGNARGSPDRHGCRRRAALGAGVAAARPAPGVVRLLVRVEPDAANRSLIVEVNSFAMYRSSLITLDGASAQAAYWLEFNSLPAGLYSVTVALRRVDGETATAQDTFTVVP